MAVIACVGGMPNCPHRIHNPLSDTTPLQGRRFWDWYVGPSGTAICICCAERGAALPQRNGVDCDPFSCDESINRCRVCFTPNGQHVANCRNWSD